MIKLLSVPARPTPEEIKRSEQKIADYHAAKLKQFADVVLTVAPHTDPKTVRAWIMSCHAVRLQRPGAAFGARMYEPMGCVLDVREGERVGLFNTRTRPAQLVDGENIEWCLTEEGRLFFERFRSVWDRLGMQMLDDNLKRVPMPWPGLPEPYQPGSIAPTF